MDDYWLLAAALQHKSFMWGIVAAGRPLYALSITQVFGMLSQIGELTHLRTFAVFGIAVLVTLVYRALSLTSLPRAVAISGALLIGLLPGYQVYAAWTTCFCFPWACALAALAFTFCNEIHDLKSGWLRLCGSILLLSMSLATYQPAGMVFWDLAAIAWLLHPNIPSMRSMLTACGVMLSSMVIEYALVKFLPIALWGSSNNFSRTALVQNYMEKKHWFFRDPLVSALNIFSIHPSSKVALIVVVLILAGFFLFYERNLSKTLVRIGIAIFLIPATFTPNLIVAELWGPYRAQVALAGLILICAIIAFLGWISFLQAHRWVPLLCLAVVSGSALAANRNLITEFVVPQTSEYQVVKNNLLKEEFKQTDKIYFKFARSNTFSQVTRYDEFGLTSSAQSWVPAPMFWLILKEHHSPFANLFAMDSPNLLTTPSPDCKIIDLNTILSPK